MFGQYKRITNQFTGVLTGKGLEYGGSLIRPEATGYGAVYFLENMLKTRGRRSRGQDRGHLRLGQCRHPRRREDRPARRQGADAVGQRGLRPRSRRHRPGEDRLGEGAQDPAPRPHLANMPTSSRARPSTPASARGASPCDVALPCATQNELLGDDARTLVANGCIAVSEGANMPTDLEGVHVFKDAKLLYAPGKASNAGGVAVSGLEMSQNSRAHLVEGGAAPAAAAATSCTASTNAAVEYGAARRRLYRLCEGRQHRRLQEGRRRDAGLRGGLSPASSPRLFRGEGDQHCSAGGGAAR